MPTGIALLDMSTEGSGPTDFDRTHDATLGLRKRRAVRLPILWPIAAKDICHFQRRTHDWSLSLEVLWWSRWFWQWGWDGQEIKRARRRTDCAGRNFEIAGGGREAAMARAELNGANLCASFQQMCGKRMAQRMGRNGFLQARAAARLLTGLLQGTRGDRSTGQLAGEKPVARMLCFPVRPQERQQRGREHDVAILAAFALVHANHHALTIDVGDFQMGRFGNA